MKRKSLFIAFILGLVVPGICLGGVNPRRFDRLLKENWYGLYIKNSKIGYVKINIEKTKQPLDGWRMESSMTMTIRMGAQESMTTVDDVRLYASPGGELYSSSMTISGPTGNVTVTGKKENGSFVVISNIGGQETKKAFEFPFDDLDNVLAIDCRIVEGKAGVGETIRTSSFEPTPPLTGKLQQISTIGGKQKFFLNGVETDVFIVTTHYPELSLIGQTKIDRFGNMLETTIGQGMLAKLEGRERAKLIEDTFDLLGEGLIKTNQRIENLETLRSLRLRLAGVGRSDILQTGTQDVLVERENQLLVAIRKGTPPIAPERLPVRRKGLERYLMPTPLEQSNTPQIVEVARKTVQNETNSWNAAKKINHWVYKNIEKRFTPDFSNALQTLRAKRGDCGEHAVLAVALMRAAGIPARTVIGLAYWPGGNGFGYHAWIEVYVGKWVQMDPAWGEDIVDPTHVALVYGGSLKEIGVLHRAIGKTRIEILN